jgi:feruloyl esterase
MTSMDNRTIPAALLAAAAALALTMLHPSCAIAQPRQCETLAALTIPNTKIESAQSVDPASLPESVRSALGKARLSTPICRVAGVIETEIRFEVWLPVGNWNGKYLATGNGAYAGSISYSAMAQAIQRGYATASTDTGHQDHGAAWALQHPERVANYGFRAHHLLAEAAKTIVANYYGAAPRHSYFSSCSAGGWEGLTEAQRYPGDYDGIVAGDPAFSILHLKARQLWTAQMLADHPDGDLPPGKRALVTSAVTAACDAEDGVKDGLISNPSICHFDYAILQCPGPDAPTCLTPAQVRTVKLLYGPARDSAGNEIYPSPAPGTPLSPLPGSQVADFFRYFVFEDPDWDWRRADIAKVVAAAESKVGAALDSTNPNLKPFQAHGGKLILYTGWMDPNVSPFDVIDYYRGVEGVLGDQATHAFARLFLVPGMGHCGGGPGPNALDALGALDQWVEKDTAPDRIVASHTSEGKIDRTRPLCPYPEITRYRGTGSTDDAANFVCKMP